MKIYFGKDKMIERDDIEDGFPSAGEYVKYAGEVYSVEEIFWDVDEDEMIVLCVQGYLGNESLEDVLEDVYG